MKDNRAIHGAETAGMALGFLGIAIFSATLPLTRLALTSFSPGFLSAGRAAMAGLVAIPFLLARGRPLPTRDLGSVVVASACLVAGFPGFSSLAMRSLPAAHAGVVVGVLPLATAVVATVIDGDRPSPAFWAAAVAGAAVVVGFALLHGGEALRAGDALLLLAIASAALGYTLSARLARKMPAGDVISWLVVAALPLSFPLAILWRPADPWAATPAAAASLLYLGLMSQYFGFFAWNAGLALGGVARVSQVQLLQTFLTIAISAVLLREPVDAPTILCAVLVAGLVFLGRRLRVRA